MHKLRLDQFLKFKGICATGGQAKFRIQAGEVKLNDAVETRRGRGLSPGDRVEVDGRVWIVEASLWNDPAADAPVPGADAPIQAPESPDSPGTSEPGAT